MLKFLDDNKNSPVHHDRSSLKAIGSIWGIPQHVLSRWILNIFKTMLGDKNSSIFIKFLTVGELYIQGFSKNLTMEVSGLDYLPRVGEAIDTCYFRGYVGGSSFYFVESIDHNFCPGKTPGEES